jgi:SAM-dependent methyltransferase
LLTDCAGHCLFFKLAIEGTKRANIKSSRRKKGLNGAQAQPLIHSQIRRIIRRKFRNSFPLAERRTILSAGIALSQKQFEGDGLHSFLKPDAVIDWSNAVPCHIPLRQTKAIAANARFFDNYEWAHGYFLECHRDDKFRERWQAATGSWDDKVVIDVGCGPGNVFATVGGKPKLLIGVDVSRGSLEMARSVGYEPLLADAHDIPIGSGVADIVVINATIHHCEDMRGVLKEAARLLAPGGVLVTDHDPQLSAWNFVGPGKWLWDIRLSLYRWIKRGYHRSLDMQTAALESEIHHRPGDGVSRELFEDALSPFCFEVKIYCHNHRLGREVLSGAWGKSELKFRVGQALSFINPNSAAAALSLMCVARSSKNGQAASRSVC